RVLCAAPAYLERYGTPETPADLSAHRIVAVNVISSATEWRFGAQQEIAVRIAPQLCVSTVAAGRDAAREGWGLCRMLSYQAGRDVAEGHLTCLLEDYEPESMPIHLVHTEGRRAPAKVRSFIDFARDRLRADPVLQALSSSKGCGLSA
ncbi:LysR family transcriptional regulator, partial [Rhodobacteraceae bacterium R_SAG7]|nr:LysR family transcriptional regulator [Rhodobacteraceae bacterium R_SAG7]